MHYLPGGSRATSTIGWRANRPRAEPCFPLHLGLAGQIPSLALSDARTGSIRQSVERHHVRPSFAADTHHLFAEPSPPSSRREAWFDPEAWMARQPPTSNADLLEHKSAAIIQQIGRAVNKLRPDDQGHVKVTPSIRRDMDSIPCLSRPDPWSGVPSGQGARRSETAARGPSAEAGRNFAALGMAQGAPVTGHRVPLLAAGPILCYNARAGEVGIDAL
jgi:hypothetical protein